MDCFQYWAPLILYEEREDTVDCCHFSLKNCHFFLKKLEMSDSKKKDGNDSPTSYELEMEQYNRERSFNFMSESPGDAEKSRPRE